MPHISDLHVMLMSCYVPVRPPDTIIIIALSHQQHDTSTIYGRTCKEVLHLSNEVLSDYPLIFQNSQENAAKSLKVVVPAQYSNATDMQMANLW